MSEQKSNSNTVLIVIVIIIVLAVVIGLAIGLGIYFRNKNNNNNNNSGPTGIKPISPTGTSPTGTSPTGTAPTGPNNIPSTFVSGLVQGCYMGTTSLDNFFVNGLGRPCSLTNDSLLTTLCGNQIIANPAPDLLIRGSDPNIIPCTPSDANIEQTLIITKVPDSQIPNAVVTTFDYDAANNNVFGFNASAPLDREDGLIADLRVRWQLAF